MEVRIFERKNGKFGVMVDGLDTHLDVIKDKKNGLFSVYEEGDAIVIERSRKDAESAIEAVY